MTTAAIDIWEQRGIVERCDVFEGDEFHGLPVLSFCPLLGDQQTDHRDALADEAMHVGGRNRPQPLDLLAIEG